jgi:hypothetical protein
MNVFAISLFSKNVGLSVKTQYQISDLLQSCQELFARPIIASVSGVWTGQNADLDATLVEVPR